MSRDQSNAVGYMLVDGGGVFQETGAAHHPPNPVLPSALEKAADLLENRLDVGVALVSDLHVTAVMDHLTGAGLAVGRGVQPAGTGWTGAPGQTPFVAYSILWRIGSLDVRSTTLVDQFDDEQPLLFIRSFGAFPQQADQQNDAVRNRMLRVPIVVPGPGCAAGLVGELADHHRTENTEVSLFEAGDFYRIRTSLPREVT
jgi:hypothetical protein